jgi:hypothetical protein
MSCNETSCNETSWNQTIAVPGVQIIACPTCSARFVFHPSHSPHIDECGFESYTLDCTECRAPLAGIIDPADDTLLVSAIAA